MNWDDDWCDLIAAKAAAQRIGNEFEEKRPDHEFTAMFQELQCILQRIDKHMTELYRENERLKKRFELLTKTNTDE